MPKKGGLDSLQIQGGGGGGGLGKKEWGSVFEGGLICNAHYATVFKVEFSKMTTYKLKGN